jgi:hypothetical protein
MVPTIANRAITGAGRFIRLAQTATNVVRLLAACLCLPLCLWPPDAPRRFCDFLLILYLGTVPVPVLMNFDEKSLLKLYSL